MRRLLSTCLLAGAICAMSPAARGAGDIVYSARYYKPGKAESYYQIWRINPDGSGRRAVTDGDVDDHSPVWRADGRAIFFTREEGGTNRLCQVGEAGGAVTTIAVPQRPDDWFGCPSPDRQSYIIQHYGGDRTITLFDLETRRFRDVGEGWGVVWSPDSRRLYVEDRNKGSFILNLADGAVQPLGTDLCTAAWLDAHTLAAERGPRAQASSLVILGDDGRRRAQVDLSLAASDECSNFADDLYAIPGARDAILYGRHAGGSSQGSAQWFYRVDLKGGAHRRLARGSGLAWSPDGKSFCTGDGRDLAPLSGNRNVWVSPLSIVSLADGRQRKIIEGLVSVGGFDWRRWGPD